MICHWEFMDAPNRIQSVFCSSKLRYLISCKTSLNLTRQSHPKERQSISCCGSGLPIARKQWGRPNIPDGVREEHKADKSIKDLTGLDRLRFWL
uniref:Uncharacterized protein n=1 Tax=Ascaris lumbricoides TaxID=6252 RepID=A0A0M3HWI5_ASCLU